MHPIGARIHVSHGHIHPIAGRIHVSHGHIHAALRGIRVSHGHTHALNSRKVPKREQSHPAAAKFGAIIRRLRTARGWTLRDLAREADMNATYIGFLERGENVPTLATILLMAKIFDVDAFEIVREVEGKGESTVPQRDES